MFGSCCPTTRWCHSSVPPSHVWGWALSGIGWLCQVAPAVLSAAGTCQSHPREPAEVGLPVCKCIIYYFYYPSPLFIG